MNAARFTAAALLAAATLAAGPALAAPPRPDGPIPATVYAQALGCSQLLQQALPTHGIAHLWRCSRTSGTWSVEAFTSPAAEAAWISWATAAGANLSGELIGRQTIVAAPADQRHLAWSLMARNHL